MSSYQEILAPITPWVYELWGPKAEMDPSTPHLTGHSSGGRFPLPLPWLKSHIRVWAPWSSAQIRIFSLTVAWRKIIAGPPVWTHSVLRAQTTPRANHLPRAAATAKNTNSWKNNSLARRSRNVSCLWQGGRAVLTSLLAGSIYICTYINIGRRWFKNKGGWGKNSDV